MKKTILIIFFLFFFSVFSFGIGMGIAEVVLRINENKKETTSKVEIANIEKSDEEKKEPEEPAIPEIKQETEKEITSPLIQEPQKAEPVVFSFAIIGDTQSYKPGVWGGYLKTVTKLNELKPDLIFSLGDQVSNCDKKNECVDKLSNWKGVLRKLASVTYLIQGNHDRTGEEKADSAWQEVFNLPTNGPAGYSELTYSFDFKNSHFVILDSEKPEERLINGEQRSWLERDLSRNKKEKTFVFFHEPAYPVSNKITESLDANPGERDALWAILNKYKATAVFVGHEHIHSRRKINNLYQFGFGNTESFNHDLPKPGVAEYSYQGQHFGLVEIKDSQITVKVYSVDGKILNSFIFEKK